MLLPHHTTIYRPFLSQIRLAIHPFLAPTSSDDLFVSQSLKESAQRLAVLLHQTAPKNAGGEEWSKAVRDLVRIVHETADLVFRAVIEDWESATSYSARAIDVNQPLHGGGKATEELPHWAGISAGVERITGLLELLAEYFRNETSTPVAMPLGSIFDLVTRMLSIAVPPSSAESSNDHTPARLHPAIDRDERDGLWSGMPQIYVAALQLINTIAERLEDGFLSSSQGSLDQLAWVFPFGKHSPDFRLNAYKLMAKTLFHVGQSFDRAQVGRLSGIIRSCCRDVQSVDPVLNNVGAFENSGEKMKGQMESSNQNADTFLRTTIAAPLNEMVKRPVATEADELLPLLLSHIPQQYLDVSLRSLVERTAILTHNKGAMLASILNPFIGKNGKTMTSILPHLTREYGNDDMVEILLRPRLPLLPSPRTRSFNEEMVKESSEDEDMDIHPELGSTEESIPRSATPFGEPSAAARSEFAPSIATPETKRPLPNSTGFSSHDGFLPTTLSMPTPAPMSKGNSVMDYVAAKNDDHTDADMDQDEESSGNESVHLTMQLDTDSDSDE
jgi:pre-rRNA-processing protein RIX1